MQLAWQDVLPCSWSEPGGDGDAANPHLPVPASVVKRQNLMSSGLLSEPLGDGSSVSGQEIRWMSDQRDLVYSLEQLSRDYGEQEVRDIDAAVKLAALPLTVAGALAWPGVGTRWRRFLNWWSALPPACRPSDAFEALGSFANALGRVKTFRALALDEEGVARILTEDEIFPSGRLHPGVDAAHLRAVVEKHGVAKVAVMRLFISHMDKIGGIDPSISLHDDWQTTSVIASGYAGAGKRVHLFELSVPAVESLGWTLQEVALRSPTFLGLEFADHQPWFCFQSPAVQQGVWFDGTLHRTERYGLFGVPFLSRRLRCLYVFDSLPELRDAVAPFVAEMARRHAMAQ